jgi:ABC-type lipoprotein export system ATPase subunit
MATSAATAPRPDPAAEDVAVAAVDVERRYRQGDAIVPALRGVSLTVARGELVAVMGPSGSGKSTLLHLLGGLDAPDAGSIVVGGHRLDGLSDDALTLFRRRTVGFVFQSFNLVPTLTVEENVALPLLLDGASLRAVRGRVRAALASVGLEARSRHAPDAISGGEAQRVAVARALIVDPAVVLADEPTGSLDSRTADAVLDLLRRAATERQQTVVMVTHDPRAAAHATRIVRIVDGAIVETHGRAVPRPGEGKPCAASVC